MTNFMEELFDQEMLKKVFEQEDEKIIEEISYMIVNYQWFGREWIKNHQKEFTWWVANILWIDGFAENIEEVYDDTVFRVWTKSFVEFIHKTLKEDITKEIQRRRNNEYRG